LLTWSAIRSGGSNSWYGSSCRACISFWCRSEIPSLTAHHRALPPLIPLHYDQSTSSIVRFYYSTFKFSISSGSASVFPSCWCLMFFRPSTCSMREMFHCVAVWPLRGCRRAIVTESQVHLIEFIYGQPISEVKPRVLPLLILDFKQCLRALELIVILICRQIRLSFAQQPYLFQGRINIVSDWCLFFIDM